nr:8063_t:CDS:2 [Entrophospora candida]
MNRTNSKTLIILTIVLLSFIFIVGFTTPVQSISLEHLRKRQDDTPSPDTPADTPTEDTPYPDTPTDTSTEDTPYPDTPTDTPPYPDPSSSEAPVPS